MVAVLALWCLVGQVVGMDNHMDGIPARPSGPPSHARRWDATYGEAARLAQEVVEESEEPEESPKPVAKKKAKKKSSKKKSSKK